MKSRDARTVTMGAIHLKMEVTLVPEKGIEDTNELRAALAVVHRYKKAAMKALSLTEKGADWTMLEYSVKNDCVVVVVEQGACG